MQHKILKYNKSTFMHAEKLFVHSTDIYCLLLSLSFFCRQRLSGAGSGAGSGARFYTGAACHRTSRQKSKR